MIIWCRSCEEAMEYRDGSCLRYPHYLSSGERPMCGPCSLNLCYPQRYVVGYRGLDGVLFTDEVSEEEYRRIITGQWSTPEPKREIAWSLEGMAAAMDRIWGDR